MPTARLLRSPLTVLAVALTLAGGCAAPGTATAPDRIPTGEVSPSASPPGSTGIAHDFELDGAWTMDILSALADDDDLSEDERALAMAFFETLDMTVTFGTAGTVTFDVRSAEEHLQENGRYEVVSRTGATLVVRITTLDPETAEPLADPEDVEIRVLDSDTATMHGDGVPVNLHRVRPEAPR